MKYSEVRSTLNNYGREIGHYHQESEGTKASANLQGHIANGFCSGASLDWLRTVLNGGNASSTLDIENAGTAFKKQRVAKRNEYYADLNTKINKAKATNLIEVNKRVAAMNNNAQAVVDLKVKELAKQKAAARLPGITQAEFDDIVDAVQRSLARNTQRLETEHDQKFAGVTVDAKFKAFWAEFGRKMDAKLDAKFGEYRYSNLTIARASANKIYGPPNGVATFIKNILVEPELTRGAGALLGISPGVGNAAGHTIAITQLNTGEFFLFDPNFGTYKMTQMNLARAFCWLFMKGYPALEGGTSDNKNYEIGGKIMAEYLIYKPR